MIRTVKKGTVEKKIDNEALLADYISAGWKLVENPKEVAKETKGFLKNERI